MRKPLSKKQKQCTHKSCSTCLGKAPHHRFLHPCDVAAIAALRIRQNITMHPRPPRHAATSGRMAMGSTIVRISFAMVSCTPLLLALPMQAPRSAHELMEMWWAPGAHLSLRQPQRHIHVHIDGILPQPRRVLGRHARQLSPPAVARDHESDTMRPHVIRMTVHTTGCEACVRGAWKSFL